MICVVDSRSNVRLEQQPHMSYAQPGNTADVLTMGTMAALNSTADLPDEGLL